MVNVEQGLLQVLDADAVLLPASRGHIQMRIRNTHTTPLPVVVGKRLEALPGEVRVGAEVGADLGYVEVLGLILGCNMINL